jgi:hypothetical protein
MKGFAVSFREKNTVSSILLATKVTELAHFFNITYILIF